VRCNQFVRFDGLIRWADDLGIDFVATGHYARVEYDPARGEYVMRKAVDGVKDQTYMLHTLQQHHLRRIRFPLGDIPKARTRELARSFGLPVAEKPDSQEICFVAGGNYREFLRQYAGADERPGDVVDREGSVLGRHAGVHAFTVGQRKGLGIAAPEPRYVLELRPVENKVVVGTREDGQSSGLMCSNLAFIGARPDQPLRCGVRIRYHAPERSGTVRLAGNTAQVHFDEPVWGVAPGQFAVFYDGDRVIGGGTIEAAHPVQDQTG
jgi:tRNA-specific 2-thiouridylase